MLSVLISALGSLICTRGPLADGSGTCTGSTQAVFAANASRRYLLIQNISDTAIYVNFGADADTDSHSVKLAAGDTLVFETGFVPTSAVNILGTATKKFVAKQG